VNSAAVLYSILEQARAKGASDITICPGEPLTLRIQKRLYRLEPVSRDLFHELLWDIQNHEIGTLERDGERFRYILYRAEEGPVLEIRHLPKKIPSLAELNAPGAFRELIQADRGLIVVTGRTGEGKSTTLAAAVEELNATRDDLKIVTLEHPIEYRHESRKALIRQRELGRHFESFPEAIEAAMRQDPNVIVIGEMRGAASIAAAITAAETGQLVLGTLHTKDAAGSVSRILDIVPGLDVPEQLAGSLIGILAQQLVPARGGGLVAAYELLTASTAVANCIREKRIEHLRDEIRRGQSRGMISMDSALEALARAGRVAKADALRRAANPAALEARLANLAP
jgi:twitching motility protein PilT